MKLEARLRKLEQQLPDGQAAEDLRPMEWRTTYKLADGTWVNFPGRRVYQPDTLALDEDAWLLRKEPSRQPLSFICVVNPEVFPDAQAAEADWRELQERWEPLRHKERVLAGG